MYLSVIVIIPFEEKNLIVVICNSNSLLYHCGYAAVDMPSHGQEGVVNTLLCRAVQRYVGVQRSNTC